MKKMNVMNLEDLILSSMVMYIIDNVSKRASFYKKGLNFKEYALNNVTKDCVELNKNEYMYFDIIGDYFNKVSESYIEEYREADKITIMLKLSRELRKDFRNFIKEHNSDTGNDKTAFGAFNIK